MTSKAALLTAVLCLACGPAASAQLLVANGGFESPAISPGTFGGTPLDGWSLASFSLIVNGNGGNPSFPAPYSGSQYADAGNVTGHHLFQTVSLPSAGTYQLSWFESTPNEITLGSAPYTASVVDSDSHLVAGLSSTIDHLGTWQGKTLQFTAAAGSYDIVFSPITANFNDVLLDEVSLTAIPEPAEYVAMTGLALAAFGAWRRPRR